MERGGDEGKTRKRSYNPAGYVELKVEDVLRDPSYVTGVTCWEI
jgi:hypothetical protein